MTLILNVTSNPEHAAALGLVAAVRGQQEAEDDYVDASRYLLDLRHFNLEEWIAGAAAAETERTFGDIAADNPAVAKALYNAAFSTAYRAAMQRLERQGALLDTTGPEGERDGQGV